MLQMPIRIPHWNVSLKMKVMMTMTIMKAAIMTLRDGETKFLWTRICILSELLSESKGVDSEWPSDSCDLTLSLARQSISVKLYNCLAWCVGYSSDPVENQMVENSSNESAKIVSIAQDLIYAESNGKKQTHKALALGMAVRQIAGSVR